jgi:hypothetical protein
VAIESHPPGTGADHGVELPLDIGGEVGPDLVHEDINRKRRN